MAKHNHMTKVASLDVSAAVAEATARIAPTWPLDRFIAVNPLWGFTEQPLRRASAKLAALTGTRLLMPRAWYRTQWQQGTLQLQHLEEAVAQAGCTTTAAHLRAVLDSDTPPPRRRPQIIDVVDGQRDLVHGMAWRQFVVHSISQFCAAHFDQGQAQVGPSHEGGLYASWLAHAQTDFSPALLMGFDDARAHAQHLPADASALIGTALAHLDVPPLEHASYLTSLLLDVNGWAAWCAYRKWTARLDGGDDDALVDLLAVRLAWELLLYRGAAPGVALKWQMAMATWPDIDAAAAASQADDWLLQQAMEIAYQSKVCAQLHAAAKPAAAAAPAVQAAFCIDVRSEVFRRALEVQSDDVATLGFAGFFGLPIDYQPLAADAARPQLPGLLAPRLRATDTGVGDGVATERSRRLGLAASWKAFKTGAASGFSFVETMGLFGAGKLLGNSLGRTQPVASAASAGLSPAEHAQRKPRLTHTRDGALVDVDTLTTVAASVLRAMSLTNGLARLVALIGHGSQTVNNPHAAGLDCGACCGQTGEVNARALAALLNDPRVRQSLAVQGIAVPETTHFVPGLHNTTTDDVALFDLDEVPSTHAPDVAQLQAWLAAAAARARRERAGSLGLDAAAANIDEVIKERASNWAEVRPEWGLANNAAFIVAPRSYTQHMNLAGRSFLHEYVWQQDTEFKILELIMTAPMVVTHWINFQYYASTVDNQRYGSGNKVLHNVVGGNLGVFEGNGGDLRIGLALQSLHDGSQFVHTPLRLSVFIAAPRPAIAAVVAKHEKVRHLVDNGWLHLLQIDDDTRAVHAYRDGEWVAAPTA